MSVEELMRYFNLSLDDLRWYLADLMAFKLMELQSDPYELTRYIWSGELESELYDIVDRFLSQLKTELEQERIDESHLHDLFKEIQAKKTSRQEAQELHNES
ncbi:MAG: hypothetical protein JXR70_15305 [Spirochaetales bacterium]|nr:hypothetical protein [Spirochaetales bacterium]